MYLAKKPPLLVDFNPRDAFALLRQNLLDVALPVEVRKPAQIVGDHVVRLAALARHDDHAPLVGLPGDVFALPGGALLARVNQRQLLGGDRAEGLLLALLLDVQWGCRGFALGVERGRGER